MQLYALTTICGLTTAVLQLSAQPLVHLFLTGTKNFPVSCLRASHPYDHPTSSLLWASQP
eukprot:1145960-Pelagomonas_calceolata.AAC.4